MPLPDKYTDAEKRIARAALGLDGRKMSYRNRYVAHQDGDQHKTLMGMVRMGCAERGTPGSFGFVGFCLTAKGAVMALEAGETLDPEDFPEAAFVRT